jgi:hypothetical protein
MKIKSTGVAVLGTAALLAAASATAGDLPWTYLEVGYAKQDGNDLLETDGFQVKGSIGFLNQWHAQVEYTDGDMDSDMELDADFDGYRLVVGAHPQLTEKTQLVADLQYFDYDLDIDGIDISTDGFGIGLGLRHSLSDKFELMAQVWYIDGEVDTNAFFGDIDYNDTVVELSGRYNWTPNLSTGVSVSLDGSLGGGTTALNALEGGFGGDVYRLDLRWSFGDLF